MNNLLLFPIHDDSSDDVGQEANAIDVDSRLIRASAGTGKTYQLTSRYLHLLLRGAAPESILATTFTRKAAGEILERIVQRLASAADDGKALGQLAQAVEMPTLSVEECRDKLQLLTRQIHRLRIYTLDAFFMQLATSFSLELGLTPGWQILQDPTEASMLKSEGIGEVLRHEDTGDLLTLVHQLTPKGTAKRSLGALLEGQVNDAYSLFLDSTADAWDMLTVPAPLADDELQEIIQQLRDCMIKGKQIPAVRDADVNRMLAANWRDFFEGKTLVKNVLDGKTKYGNAKIPEDVLAIYERFLQHLKAKILQMSAGQTRAARAFLEKYDEHFRRIKQEQQLSEFDDVTRMLARRAKTTDLTSMSYRLDAGIEHLLLDEFQDTSIPQWQALAPLALRCTTEGGKSLFCVGDVKQAIYGWRGATSEIFDVLGERLPNLTQDSLQQSRRSAPVVIDAVNQVFEHLPQWERLKRGARAAQDWEFPQHSTVHEGMPGYVTLEVAPAGEDYSKATQDSQVYQQAAQRVAAIAQHAPDRSIGVLCRTNHVVARMMHALQRNRVSASEEGGNYLTDSAAVELVLSLLHLSDHPSDSTCAFHLAASPWGPTLGLRVELPIARQLAGDGVSDDGEVEATGVGPTSNGTSDSLVPESVDEDGKDEDGKVAKELRRPTAVDPIQVRRLARDVRRQLQNHGYGATVRGWAEQLRSSCNRREARRLEQLVEKAFEFQNRLESPRQLGYARQSRLSTRPAAFVRHIRETKFSDPSADTIRVMTVHQSKGLQFDMVVLPDLVQPLVSSNDAFLYQRETVDSDVNLVCRYIGKDRGRKFLPENFQPLFDQHEDRKTRETLSVLYVAMTRAVHALYMFVPAGLPSYPGGRENTAYLVKDALCPDAKMEPAVTLYEAGDKHWFMDNTLSRAEIGKPLEPKTPEVRLARRRVKRRYLETIAPSQIAIGERVRLSERFAQGRQAEARNFGTLMHIWLSQIQWLETGQGVPARDRLKALAQGFEERLDIDAAYEKLVQLAEGDVLRQVLVRDQYLAELKSRLDGIPEDSLLEVRNEQPIAGRHQSGIVSGTVDRLILVRSGGQLIGADVLDYKTDLNESTSETAQQKKLDRYAAQMATYRTVLMTSLRLDESRIGSKLVLL